MAEYVEREQAINFARAAAAAAYNRDDFGTYRDLNAFIATLVFIPAADVVPVKHGKWIEYQIPHYFKCSECKCTVPYVKAVLIDGKRKYNYCPACGAKMDEVTK